MVNRIAREFRLDPAQCEKPIHVFKGAREKLHAIRLQAAPQVEMVFSESENDIKSFLDDGQKLKFEHMIERRKHFFDKMHHEN